MCRAPSSEIPVGLFISWVLDSAQVIIQNISHLQMVYNNIINNVFPVIHFTVQESSIQCVNILKEEITSSSHYGFYIIAFSPFTYVYIHSSYTKKRPLRSSFIQPTYQKTLLITEHFLGFCPRALRFKLPCWPLLTNEEKLLPIILSHQPCMPLVHNDIFEALNLFAKGTKCRCVLGLRLLTCRRENRG